MTREQAINSMISHGFTVEQAGEIIKAVTPQLSSELEKNSKKLEKGTTKNDLGVDLISRNEVLNRLASIAKIKAKSDAQKSLMGRCMFMVERMPSVTPQLSVPEVTALAEWTEKLTKASEDAYNKGYADGMKEQEPRWIPCSERLPEIHNYCDKYLVTLECGWVRTSMFTECDGKSWWSYDDVVAWMPLPQPYREVKE